MLVLQLKARGDAVRFCTWALHFSLYHVHVHEAKKYILQLHRNNISSPVGIKYLAFSWGGQ
jgi:hypothetical protein